MASEQENKSLINKRKKLKNVIHQLEILGKTVEEPQNIKRYKEYFDLMQEVMLSRRDERYARRRDKEKTQKTQKSDKGKTQSIESKTKALREKLHADYDPNVIPFPLNYTKDNLVYLQEELWKDSDRKKGQTRKRRRRHPKTKKVKKKIKKHTPKRTKKTHNLTITGKEHKHK